MRKLFVFCVSFLFHGAVAQKVIRTAFLQSPSATEMTIRWETDTPNLGSIYYYEDGKKAASKLISETVPSVMHELRLKSLNPDTKYFYSLAANSQGLEGSDFQFFYTSKSSGNTKPIYVWAMGDFGDLSLPKYVDNQTKVRDSFVKYTSGIHTDLWLWLGDNAYCCGTSEQYQTGVFDFYGSSLLNNIPVMPVPGNHEYYGSTTAQQDRKIPYFDIFTLPSNGESGGIASCTEAYYSYNYGNIHFVALDSYGFDNGKFRLSDVDGPQYQWLVNDLKADNSQWTVVYMHHPPYSRLSHVSDLEPELRKLREMLVPLFDQEKVDLVLSGHSHVYERSYLIKGHYFTSDTFSEEQHLVQQTAGHYTKDSKPYINKDEGTVYAVVGSAGRLDWNNLPGKMNSTAYANKDIGGSLLLKVEENRLDAEWIAADGEVKDRFTMLKGVDQSTTSQVKWGDTVSVRASWPGTYIWPDGNTLERGRSVFLKSDTTISVTDSLGFLKDVFKFKVAPQVIAQAVLIPNESVCTGKETKVELLLQNAEFEDYSFTLELLKDNQLIYSLPMSSASVNFSLPETIKEGSGYQFRISPNSSLVKVLPSEVFSISNSAYVEISNSGIKEFVNQIDLNLRALGSFPIQVTINESEILNLISEYSSLSLTSPYMMDYHLSAVSNVCGTGIFGTEKLFVESPLSVNEMIGGAIKVFPNPADEIIIIEHQESEVNIKLFDLNGRILLEEIAGTGKKFLDIKNLPNGQLILSVEKGDHLWRSKILKR